MEGLALRGHRETLQESDDNQNLGNFLTYLKELQNYCPELKEHLEAPQSKSVTYLSPTSQNEMIEVIGKKIILRDIVEEMKKKQASTKFLQTNELLVMTRFYRFAFAMLIKIWKSKKNLKERRGVE